MQSSIPKLFCLLAIACIAASLRAAEPDVDAAQLPRIPATEPAAALKAFQIRDGFKLELAVAEPNIASPIAMAFDEDSRLYVVEMRDYSERRDEKLGRIRLLEDHDGDGYFEHSTIFADGLGWPTAIICANGGIFVGCTPDILFLKDTDADGRADQKTVVFTGFADGVERLNVQGLVNSFNWGIDNRIHGATGLVGGRVLAAGSDGKDAINLRGKDFSFNPRTLDLRPESGGSQHGLTFDAFGNKFVCSNSSHIQAVMYDHRYAGRNKHYSMPSSLAEIAADGGAAEVFRLSPNEPWRVIRTKWRVAGLVSGPIEGGGRASGYFTGATGVTIYTGDAWPAEFLNNAFVGDAGGNLVHRKLLRRSGASFIAERPKDELKREFLASPDNWFRPVQFANGPDGNLCVIDMYRETIEHPWSIPQSIKQHLDLDSGRDRGRIYRIIHNAAAPRRPWTKLSRASTQDLVSLLNHPNGWHRQTASRLLLERNDPTTAALLAQSLDHPLSTSGHIHVLNTLQSLGILGETPILDALGHADPHVRRWGIRLAEEMAQSAPLSNQVSQKLSALARDIDASARCQLALSLSMIDHPSEPALLRSLIAQDTHDPWISAAILNAASAHAPDLARSLIADPAAVSVPSIARFLEQLVGIAGQTASNDQIQLLFQAIALLDPRQAVPLAAAIADAQHDSHAKITHLPAMKVLLDHAQGIASRNDLPEATRASAIRLLGLAPESQIHLWSLLDPKQSAAIHRSVLSALDHHVDRSVAIALCGRYSGFAPSARRQLIALMLKRPERAVILLRFMWGRIIPESDLSTIQIRQLETHPDSNVRLAISAVRQRVNTAQRGDVVKRYSPALSLKGNPKLGQAVFKERCSTCHRLAGEGSNVGPDLLTVRAAGKERLLESIIDPSREVPGNFLAYKLDTRDGETFVGLLVREDASGVTLRQPGGLEEQILSRRIKSLRPLSESLMPEGLEEGLEPQGMADLLEFIAAGN